MKAPRLIPEGTLNSLTYAWPELLDPRDPWAGDEALPDSYDYANYAAFGGADPPLDPATYAGADAEFLQVYRDILDGRRAWDEIRAPATRIGVWGPAGHDLRPLESAPQRVPDELLADHSEDWIPDIGLQAPDRVLGPWVEGPLPARVRLAAAAAVAFSPWVEPGVTPAERVSRSKPKPSKAYRASLRAISMAPPMVWAIEGQHLRPHLPLGRRFLPTGPVSGLPEAPAALGRAVPCEEGWFLACALPLPGLPPRAGLTRRIFLELLRLRRDERRATWEDALRRRPEVLYRTALSWAWLERRTSDWSWGAREEEASRL